MGSSCLADHLSHFIDLTEYEHDALAALEEQPRVCKKGTVIQRENDPVKEPFIVQKGWLHSGLLLGSGSRQIMRFHFSGDVVGLSCLAFEEAPDTITAVTEVTLCPFDRTRLVSLFAEHPRLAGLIFSLAMAERVSLADRLASIGRTSARARVASLLCEIFSRLRITEGEALSEIHLPLTQEDIGDATGLTAVHVNRMMRGLVDNGIIERNGNMVRLLDEQRLFEEANFTDRLRMVDTGWLPPPQ